MTTEDRYYVSEISGFYNSGFDRRRGGISGNYEGLSFSILDRYVNHREVYVDYHHSGVSGITRRYKAQQECARLNALDLDPDAA
jgi:hypothetical protein